MIDYFERISAGTFLGLLCIIFLVAGCSRRPVPEPLTVKILVHDFEVSDNIESSPEEIRGWWFGSRDIRRNPNSGIIFADILAREINEEVNPADVYSRTDYKYYLANKKRLLEEEYPSLNNQDIEALMNEIPPLDFARDLQVDLLIIGNLNAAYTTHSRAFHWWSSVIDASLMMLDVNTGDPVWTKDIRVRKNLGSQPSAMQKAADEITKDLKGDYFYKQD